LPFSFGSGPRIEKENEKAAMLAALQIRLPALSFLCVSFLPV
jgi:hypothetical protein